MTQASPTETSLAALLRQRGAGLGPSITRLARELEPRLDAVHGDALLELIRSWPMEADGTPRDADALYHRLLEMRALPAALPHGAKPGSPGGNTAGMLLGAVAVVPIGFILFVLVGEFFLPRQLRTMEAMWVAMAAAMALGGFIGLRQGGSRSRGGRTVARGILGFLMGAVGGALTGVVVAGVLGWLLEVSQREGAFAMGVVFVIAPLSGLAGGVLLGGWMARKAWRGSA